MLQRHRSSLLLHTICICIVYNLIRYADPMVSTMNVLMGSSPRMRGSPYGEVLKPAQDGIIPAHAGLTFNGIRIARPVGDHPRACEAHFCGRPSRCGNLGSSPRMRGSHDGRRTICGRHGIIPAYAGLTDSHGKGRHGHGDHPRVYGAHFFQEPQ